MHRLKTVLLALVLARILVASVGLAAEVVSPAECLTDDASGCIEAAIGRAALSKSQVLLVPGVYTLRTPIELVSGVSLLGGSGTILRPSPSNRESVLLVYGGGVSNVTIEGITFDGGGRDFPSESALIVLNGTQNVVLSRVTLQHARGSALAVYSDSGIASIGNGVQGGLVVDVGNHWRTTKLPSGRMMGLDFWTKHH